MVVFEIEVPTEAFALENALRQFPDVVVELERVVPTNHSVFPYFWASDGQSPAFKRTVAGDQKVSAIEKVASFEMGALYRIEWQPDDGSLLQWCTNSHNEVSLLQAEGHGSEWTLKLRFPSREVLREFRSYYEDQDIRVDVLRIYELKEPKMGQFNVSEKQRETLIRALEMGYFEIPRDVTLRELSQSLGISHQSASERLRRGYMNLISNSLTIGYPTSIGLGER